MNKYGVTRQDLMQFFGSNTKVLYAMEAILLGDIEGQIKNNQTNLIQNTVTLTNAAGAQTGTLTNAPSAGNPSKWVQINDNGTIRKIPTWT